MLGLIVFGGSRISYFETKWRKYNILYSEVIMINKKKILIYRKYDGNLDAWARIATLDEKGSMSDDDWYLIDELIQDIIISRPNIEEILKKNTEDKETINEILNVAIEYRRKAQH